MIDEYLGKKLKSNFVFGFSQNHFFNKKVQNRPRFSDMIHPIELKLFIQVLDSVLGAAFYCFEKYFTVDFWHTLQKSSIQNKHAFF